MNIPIWPGSSSFTPGDTPFGFYDNDIQFQQDADKFAKFAAQRLGYPLVEVELQDINFYTALEDAVTTGITGATQLTNMMQITSAGYSAITSPAANTLYIIVG